MFTDYYSCKSTPFDKLLENILKGLKSGWRLSKARETYLETFPIVIWEALSECNKIRLSLSYCEACGMEYLSVQEVFPLKPVFNSCKPNTEDRETTINSLLDGRGEETSGRSMKRKGRKDTNGADRGGREREKTKRKGRTGESGSAIENTN